MRVKKICIFGAGITGLRLAEQLLPDVDVILIEKRPRVGGLSASFFQKGFILDLGPHKFSSEIPGIMSEFKNVLKGKFQLVEKRISFRLQGTDFSYPLKIRQLAFRFPKAGNP